MLLMRKCEKKNHNDVCDRHKISSETGDEQNSMRNPKAPTRQNNHSSMSRGRLYKYC